MNFIRNTNVMRQLRSSEQFTQLRRTDSDLVARVHHDYETYIENEVDKSVMFASRLDVCLFYIYISIISFQSSICPDLNSSLHSIDTGYEPGLHLFYLFLLSTFPVLVSNVAQLSTAIKLLVKDGSKKR
jgi:hypothetical protein